MAATQVVELEPLGEVHPQSAHEVEETERMLGVTNEAPPFWGGASSRWPICVLISIVQSIYVTQLYRDIDRAALFLAH